MSHPPTAREALIAEMLGDVARILDRVDVLIPALDRARIDLADQLAIFEGQMSLLTEKAKLSTAEHIAKRANEAATTAARQQTHAMAEAARAIFRTELEHPMRLHAHTLQQLVQSLQRPWRYWIACTLAFVVGALFRSALS
jgi:hypothetical protein